MDRMTTLLGPVAEISLSLLATYAALALVGAGMAYSIYCLFICPLYSSLADLPGPERASLLFGNLAEIFDAEAGVAHAKMIEKYGGDIKYGGFFGDDRLLLSDPAALAHILVTKSYDYPKPNAVRGDLGRILGEGVLFAEGDDHKRQRKILLPAFSPPALRALTPVFFSSSYQLRDKWMAMIADGTVDERAFKDADTSKANAEKRDDSNSSVIEVANWMSRLTLDIIGLTGFGYAFNALSGESNELANAFGQLTSGGGGKLTAAKILISRVLGFLISYVPIARYLPNKRLQAVRNAFAVMESESKVIIATRRREVEEAGPDSMAGKDLMSILLRASMGDAKNSMSESELMGQLTTFILAGHETTSTVLTWLLYTLSEHTDVQEKLRAEIRAALKQATEEGREELGADELASLPYLDAVCREILRFEPAVTATIRSSTYHDDIPLSTPIKTRSGKMISSIHVNPGQIIFLPITAINMNKAVFGDDAAIFRPERWIEGHVGEKSAGVGVYSHLMTFIAGPRSCIGYKFSLLELKAILVVLFDSFKFEERPGGIKIERRSAIVMRPFIVGEEELGGRMPLKVSLADRD